MLKLPTLLKKTEGEAKEKIDFHSIEYRIKVLKEYLNLWSDYFRAFGEGLRERKIYESDEQSFFQIMSLLALNHYRFEQMAGEYVKDPDKVLDVLCETVSLNHLKTMSEAQFSKLEVDWHTIFIAINKGIGKLIGLLPPERAEKIKA
ncbi:MAG: hypothetical protein N2246_00255 [Candidatus Sumerlaeia bacterium]|nr:hypothetical protein [Candidatus Sumerlaeia bacterium]